MILTLGGKVVYGFEEIRFKPDLSILKFKNVKVISNVKKGT